MKKFICLCLALVMTCGLVACGNKTEEKPTDTNPTVSTPADVETTPGTEDTTPEVEATQEEVVEKEDKPNKLEEDYLKLKDDYIY